MREIEGFDQLAENQGGEFEQLPADGYICVISSVEDVADKEYLKIEFDIAEGKYKGWFANMYSRAGFWGGRFIRSYKEKAASFFKGFTTAVESSNAGYKWAWNEQSLVGKKIGLVLAHEEYHGNDGRIKIRPYVVQNRSVDAITKGDFRIPSLKPLEGNAQQPSTASQPDANGFVEIPASKLPF